MGLIPTGSRMPFQVILVAGLLMLIPSIDFRAEATALREDSSPTATVGMREDDIQRAILAEIIERYPTYMTLEEKHQLPFVIVDLSHRYGYDPLFVAGVIQTESSFNNRAVSVAGARGLMQLIPYVAEAMASELGMEWGGIPSLHEPAVNIELGLYYLRKMEERFGNLDVALAAYNMGPSLLEQKMATGFRPHGVYAGKINGTYLEFRTRAEQLRPKVLAEATL